MVAHLRAKPGGADTPVTVGDTVTFDASGVRRKPFVMRYAWPEQIDELAERAGLRLTERYADWDRTPFEADSRAHISVHRRR
ncbi:hypothetical protein O7622_29040 [Micromonospora sp. WMMD1076]|uniref:hypothetical protein n=1 Tax=Micromonospora sp. WMMD1076 TaxID=3016103 RepID=UPI00249A9937|nr:hypothetical protein [Micromonospora sp. WMMD1076]WFF07008.1 hypothetical protein O7622_29040 [Micromonospora sp. WMMD1076]